MGTCTIEPLVPSRGLPADFEIVDDCWHPTVLETKYPELKGIPPYQNCILLGEWGYSWLLASEIIRAPAPRVPRTVSIPISEYRQWDGASEPTPWQWASANFGHVVGMPDKITSFAEKIVVEWDYDFTEDFRYFVDKVCRLRAMHGEIRVVYGFG